MPALSPTMTEGNIATWKVKEGENFAAGDVLLEIETDKATMDVEAQEDGIVMKIMAADGSKAVQVGTRIAVLAEAGDDISSLELPADESPKQETPKKEAAQQESSSQKDESPSAPAKKSSPPPTDGKKFEQKYPLYPSVQQLIHYNNLDADTVASITPTGPQGRLLKGDVLAFVGAINAETPGKLSERFTKLGHLDLSNVKVAKKKEAAATTEPKPAPVAAPPQESEVAVTVTLAKAIEASNRISETLGVFLPLSTFIARAAEVANDDLPPSSRQPSAEELFNQVLGLDKLQPRTSRGAYMPQISALEPSFLAPRPAAPAKQADIIDILAAQPKQKKAVPAPATRPGMSSSGPNVFSLVVPKGDEKRASVFLERVKAILETEPGRLVL